ncbi:MAG: hypothetical protein AAF547_06475 [Actinomycetota bacterium]
MSETGSSIDERIALALDRNPARLIAIVAAGLGIPLLALNIAIAIGASTLGALTILTWTIAAMAWWLWPRTRSIYELHHEEDRRHDPRIHRLREDQEAGDQ